MKFQKGNTYGKKFSSAYQPKVCGRRPAVLKALDKQYELSMTDQRKWYAYLRTLSVEELQGLADDKTLPVWQSELARFQFKAVAKGDLAVYRELQDRFYGKPKEQVDVTTNGKEIQNTLQIEVIDSREQVRKEEDTNN